MFGCMKPRLRVVAVATILGIGFLPHAFGEDFFQFKLPLPHMPMPSIGPIEHLKPLPHATGWVQSSESPDADAPAPTSTLPGVNEFPPPSVGPLPPKPKPPKPPNNKSEGEGFDRNNSTPFSLRDNSTIFRDDFAFPKDSNGGIDRSTTNAIELDENATSLVLAAQLLTANSICETLLHRLFNIDDKCADGRFYKVNQARIDVSRQENPLPFFTARIVGHTLVLAGVSQDGYESHRLALITCLDFQGVPQLLAFNFEPLYNPAELKNILNNSDPNTAYIGRDNDMILSAFQTRVREAIVEEIQGLEAN